MDAIMKLLSDFDADALLPDLSTTLGLLELVARIGILIIPIVLVILGLCYFFKPTKEANYTFGYRTYFGMGSVEAWRYTQWLAGVVLGGLGAVLTVAMVIAGFVFAGQNTLNLLLSAATCMFIEVLLTLAANIAINIAVLLRYDRDGYRRGTR